MLDVSATFSWLMADERDEAAVSMLAAVLKESATVPLLWRWELQNALLLAMRRGRLSQTVLQEMLHELAALPIQTDQRPATLHLLAEILAAQRFLLSAYDAAYLELAARTGLRLMTRDLRLSEAAKTLGLLWEATPGPS